MGYRTYSCPAMKRCGACQWLAVPYPLQLSRKAKEVDDLLGEFGSVDPVIGMDDPYHFRNKVISPFAPGPKGSIRYGLYEEGTHRIVNTDGCLVTSEESMAILQTIAKLMRTLKIPPYDEDSQHGFLRNVLIRESRFTGEIMVVFVCAGLVFPAQRSFVSQLCRRHPRISTIVMNINTRRTNIVLGWEERVLYGKGWITDELCGKTFRISSRSFFQTNPVQTEKLYTSAIEMADLSADKVAIDAYCGIGTIGIIAAEKAGHVIGVESNADAVRDAKANAKRNEVGNIEFSCADATVFMEELAASSMTTGKAGRAGEKVGGAAGRATGGAADKATGDIDVVFLDPPRAGATPEFLSACVHLAPSRIVYISCNPVTQARDLKLLVPAGYRVTRIQPVDMFPHTPHLECICALERTR